MRERKGGNCLWKLPLDCTRSNFYAKEGEFHSRLDCLITLLMLSPWQAVAMRKTSSQSRTSSRTSQCVQRGAASKPSILERADGEKVSSFPTFVMSVKFGTCRRNSVILSVNFGRCWRDYVVLSVKFGVCGYNSVTVRKIR